MKRGPLCLAALLAVTAPPAAAQPPDPTLKLTLSPAAAPVPALRYALLPHLADTQPGNAAVFYQRAAAREWWSNLDRGDFVNDAHEWIDRPWKEVPRAKVELVRYLGALREVDHAARREHCDWQLTSRLREEGIGMLIPDVQGFRTYAMLLAMRCRFEIAERQYDRAAYTLQTMLQLARHVSDAPLLINALVGHAIVAQALDRVEEWIQQPEAPNLYWALTSLPRPLIDLRKGLEGEKVMVDGELPQLRTLEKERLGAESQEKLMKKFDWISALSGAAPDRHGKHGFLIAAMRAYPAAKRGLIAGGRKAEEVESMPVLQVLLLDSLHLYHKLYDDMFKWVSEPYHRSRAALGRVEQEAAELRRDGRGIPLIDLIPATQKVFATGARTERRVAALRCVEAIRLHAAAHKGKLPARLSDITLVPVPEDPASGRPFDYRVEGDRAILTDPDPPALHQGLRYEITLRR